MSLSYRNSALGTLPRPDPSQVRDLQIDLRALGYLLRHIDGIWGTGTREAVRHLQYDLLHNDGRSDQDGPAPVAMTSFNRGVKEVSGIVDAALCDSIEALLISALVPKLPSSNDPKVANQTALHSIPVAARDIAPTPFLLAIFRQESADEHYVVPMNDADHDTFITVGLDTGDRNAPDHVTSRGYGLGQYTIHHHPPRPDEVADFMLDPVRNVRKAATLLREKFNEYVLGPCSTADDRMVDHPEIKSLRVCAYRPNDPRYMSDCHACASAAPKVNITPYTPLYHRSTQSYGQAHYYKNPSYSNVPDRAGFPCDWPYAARRYNGSSPDSYCYQAIILKSVLDEPLPVEEAVA